MLVLSREGDDSIVRGFALGQIRLEGMEVLDGPLDSARDHHRPRLSADIPGSQNLFVEVIRHDLGLEPDRIVVALHVASQLLADFSCRTPGRLRFS
jgi:hypothetical protein